MSDLEGLVMELREVHVDLFHPDALVAQGRGTQALGRLPG